MNDWGNIVYPNEQNINECINKLQNKEQKNEIDINDNNNNNNREIINRNNNNELMNNNDNNMYMNNNKNDNNNNNDDITKKLIFRKILKTIKN